MPRVLVTAGTIAVVGGVLASTAGGWTPTPSPGLVVHGPRTLRLAALTFDADLTPGMSAALRTGRLRSAYDPRIVRELVRTRTPATLFLTGMWTLAYPGVARRLARDRLFEIENHSFDHAAWELPCYGLAGVLSAAAKRAEVLRAARAIRRVARVRARYFRFPGGCQDEADVRLVRSLGEQPVQWDVVSGDSYLFNVSAVERQVLTEVRPGSIVVLHLDGAPMAPTTAAALDVVIPDLKARGFRFVTVRTLLAAGVPH